MVLTYWLTISGLTFAYHTSLLTFPTVHQLCYWSFIWIHESLSVQVEHIFIVFKCIRCWKFKQNFRLNHLSSRFASVTVNLGPTFLSGESFFLWYFELGPKIQKMQLNEQKIAFRWLAVMMKLYFMLIIYIYVYLWWWIPVSVMTMIITKS